LQAKGKVGQNSEVISVSRGCQ